MFAHVGITKTATEDCGEVVGTFPEKRPPQWRGK
jgi:hypothetical protein